LYGLAVRSAWVYALFRHFDARPEDSNCYLLKSAAISGFTCVTAEPAEKLSSHFGHANPRVKRHGAGKVANRGQWKPKRKLSRHYWQQWHTGTEVWVPVCVVTKETGIGNDHVTTVLVATQIVILIIHMKARCSTVRNTRSQHAKIKA
jgi:hypothetical protein